jgi:hypothetical protein
MDPIGGIGPPSYKSIIANNIFGRVNHKTSQGDFSHISSQDNISVGVLPSQEPTLEDFPQSNGGPTKWNLGQCIPKVVEMPK